ncbi:YciI family protein [Arcanobacterium hippocoleae]
MKIIAVKYTYNPERSAELTAHRPKHREFLRSLFNDGTLLASGPLAENEALIILRADHPAQAETLLNQDPLYIEDVILEREAKVWNPVIGPWN